MARFRKPKDPRDGVGSYLRDKRPRRQRESNAGSIPWIWLGLGTFITLAAIVVSVALLNSFLLNQPLSFAAQPTPTIIRLTAPATKPPTATPNRSTATPIPTLTPFPTPDLSIAPDEVTIGYFAEVFNTGGVGVTVRGGPSTNNVALFIADEGSVVQVLDGPSTGSSFEWWQVELDDGTAGWVAADFLRPTEQP